MFHLLPFLEVLPVIKPRTPPGLMELLPREQIAFQRMLDVIRRNYERFGFLPIETPVFELSDVLLTKSGGETERQVYFVQSSGALANAAESENETKLPELALRFDLTVPLARYVAEHAHELTFPFRRYQMQRVYRGERPQRGRFREFYQCDIDIIGKQSLSIHYDAEVLAVIYAVFAELGIGQFIIQLNNRKLMRGFFQSLGVLDSQKQALILREVDKLDKHGSDYVRTTLTNDEFNLSDEIVKHILDFVQIRSNSYTDALQQIDQLSNQFNSEKESNNVLDEGINELREVVQLVHALGVPESAWCLNFSIARGLDYYTGTVYETLLTQHPHIGSICSGGRYENLASHYSKTKLPGVGISIGLTRLFWQLRQAGLISGVAESSVHALVALMDETGLAQSLDIARHLRAGGINTEVQMEAKKISKQFQYASKAGIRFVVLAGSDELARGVVAVKDLQREQQFEVSRDELAAALQVELEQARVMAN